MDSQHKQSTHVKLSMWCSTTQYRRIKGTKVMFQAPLTSVLSWIEWWVNFRLDRFIVDKITFRTLIGSCWAPEAVRSGRETIITVPTGDRIPSHTVSNQSPYLTDWDIMSHRVPKTARIKKYTIGNPERHQYDCRSRCTGIRFTPVGKEMFNKPSPMPAKQSSTIAFIGLFRW